MTVKKLPWAALSPSGYVVSTDNKCIKVQFHADISKCTSKLLDSLPLSPSLWPHNTEMCFSTAHYAGTVKTLLFAWLCFLVNCNGYSCRKGDSPVSNSNI